MSLPKQCPSCGGNCGTTPCSYGSLRDLQLEAIKTTFLIKMDAYILSVFDALVKGDGQAIEDVSTTMSNEHILMLEALKSHAALKSIKNESH